MDLDLKEYNLALAQERDKQDRLDLAVKAFGAGAIDRGVAARGQDQTMANDPNFDENEHRRGADGKFIQMGDSGPEVRAVADAMGMGSLPNEFDEDFEAQVREYQRRNGLLVDGIVGAQTAASLISNEDGDTKKPGEISNRQVTRLIKQMRQSNVSKRKKSEDDQKSEEE